MSGHSSNTEKPGIMAGADQARYLHRVQKTCHTKCAIAGYTAGSLGISPPLCSSGLVLRLAGWVTLFWEDLIGKIAVAIFDIHRSFFDINQRQLVIVPATQTGLE